MAGKSSSDKTEQPTDKRIRDSRKKGQVAKSNEVGSVATLVAVVMCFWSASDMFIQDVEALIISATYLGQVESQTLLLETGRQGLTLLVKISLIITGAAAVSALVLNFLQVGPVLAFEAVMPKLSNINPADKIKKLFSMDSVVQMVKSIIKIVLLATILFIAVRGSIPTLFSLADCELGCILPLSGVVLNNIIVYSMIVFIAVAAVDVFLSRRKYIKDLMMTKEEVKQEFKESEGDPHKGKRKQLFSEIVNSQQVNNVKRSSVVVTNPTHVAIGLFYDEDETPLPIVTFKAEGALAKRLIEVAEKEGVPVMQNVPLAHSLLEQSRVEHYIPQELIKPVAEVLKVIRDLR